MSNNTGSKHKFTFYDGYSLLAAKLKESIVKKVNEIDKTVNVAQLDEFPDFFIVRLAHPKVHALHKELEKQIVENLGYVTLCAENFENKKIGFGVWKRIYSSEILN